MMITDFRLLVFRTVAHKRNFTKAAEELSISQPAASRHINELETQLGGALFFRETGGIRLTEKGERLLEYADRILYLYKCLDDELICRDSCFRGNLSIGASTTIANYVLPGIVSAFRTEYPGIRLTVKTGNSEQIEQMLREKDIEIGITENHGTRSGIRYEHFTDDEIVLVGRNIPEKYEPEEISLEEFRKSPLVIREYGSGTLDVIEHELERHRTGLRDLNVEMQLGSTESIKRYLYNSNAYALISVSAIKDELANNRLRIIDITGVSIKREFRFITLQGAGGRMNDIFKDFCMKNINKN